MDPVSAHAHSSRHRASIERSDVCGCFYCLATYAPAAIVEWIDEPGGGQTAMCPACGIDSVVGSASGAPITDTFLRAMHVRWFS